MTTKAERKTLAAVASLADPRPCGVQRAAAEAMLDDPRLDLLSVLRIARDNGVHAVVSHRVLHSQARGGFSAETLAYARAMRDEAIFRELVQRRLLGELLGALDDAGSPPPILLKGAALRETLYPEPWQRAMDDVDLLVGPGELDRAERALAPLGFERRELTPERAATESAWHARTLLSEGASLRVDLHGALARPGRFDFDLSGLRARARRVTLEGREALVLDDGDALIGLAVHTGEMAGRGALKRLVDLSLLVRRGRFAWAPMIRRARAAHAVGAVRLALWLTERAMGSAPPPWAWRKLHGRSARHVLLRALAGPPPRAPFGHVRHPRAREIAALYWLPDGPAHRLGFAARYAALRVRDAVERGRPRRETGGE